MAVVLLGVIGMIALMSLIGYLPAFFLFLIVTLWGLGIRSSKTVFAVSIGFFLFIYGVFDVYLQLDLPKGLIMGFFN